MRISHRHRFVFFSNPKTGSSTVRQFLNPYSDVVPAPNYREKTEDNPFYPHMRPEEARRLFHRFGWDFEGYAKFVFVRNPWARLVSLFEHIRRATGRPLEFSDWVYTIKPCGSGGGGEAWERWRCYGAYSIEHFIKDEAGNILVDKVLRLEDIDASLVPYLRAMGLPVAAKTVIAHKNRHGAGRRYRDYYSDDSAAHVADLYRYDIVHYGYTFS